MKQVNRIDKNDLYIEPVIVDDDEKLTPDLIAEPVPEGFYHPKWNGTQWIEGLTKAEIDALVNVETPKTEIDILKEQNADLNLQIIDIWETLIAGGVA